ncbi:phage major tail tube protein [Pseudodesulfovibrio pelocollis]|uniref:phage major tail tube protein n=1 Tax=Pseudodesulfovibrio pelocollis TaxID=3051432 RepID=UPI00255ABE59|nr:phage major tail tube protein [Pseudodesulfovibrio sp. SB368]
MSNIPEKLVAFEAYLSGETLLGVVDAEITDITFLSEELRGAGIAGAIKSITLGHVEPMEAKIKFRVKTSQSYKLLAPAAHMLELRASKQSRTVGGALVTSPERVVLQGTPAGIPGGKYEAGKAMDNEFTFSVTYLKMVENGVDMLEIDQLGYKFVVDGVDYLAGVRADLGREG